MRTCYDTPVQGRAINVEVLFIFGYMQVNDGRSSATLFKPHLEKGEGLVPMRASVLAWQV